MPFEQEKRELEEDGFQHEGGFIACPAVGGDHDREMWVNPETGATIEVCQHCQTIG